jgi:hypothetical protein
MIPFSIFSANDFIKKKYFFVPIDLNNGIKISRPVIRISGRFLIAEGEDTEVFILSTEVIK